MERIALNERLRSCRREAGMTQEALGAAIGVHANTIRKWENGSRSPDARKLRALADTLGTTIAFLSGEGSGEPAGTLKLPQPGPHSEKEPESMGAVSLLSFLEEQEQKEKAQKEREKRKKKPEYAIDYDAIEGDVIVEGEGELEELKRPVPDMEFIDFVDEDAERHALRTVATPKEPAKIPPLSEMLTPEELEELERREARILNSRKTNPNAVPPALTDPYDPQDSQDFYSDFNSHSQNSQEPQNSRDYDYPGLWRRPRCLIYTQGSHRFEMPDTPENRELFDLVIRGMTGLTLKTRTQGVPVPPPSSIPVSGPVSVSISGPAL